MLKNTRIFDEMVSPHMQRLGMMGVRFVEGPAAGQSATPPWGSPEEFDPEKAWNLIQNLRTEVKEAKDAKSAADSSVADLTNERDQYATQVEELQATVQLTDDTAKELETNLTKEQFGRKFDNLAHERGIPLDVASRLAVDTEEDAIAALDQLAGWRGKQEPQARQPDPAQVAEPTGPNADDVGREFFGV